LLHVAKSERKKFKTKKKLKFKKGGEKKSSFLTNSEKKEV